MSTGFTDIDSAMRFAVGTVLAFGEESSPRGKKVKERIGQSIAFDMRYPLVTCPSRKLGYRFAPAEAAWILSGRNDKRFFEDLNMPFIWEFSDDGIFYQGAYGPPLIQQLSYVCDVLSDDHDTRQAVVSIWQQNPRPSRDIPCTVSFQFIARQGKLHCVQSMRSSDVWLGYPYDAFNAAMLTGYIILLLKHRKKRGRDDLTMGTHTMLIGSQHLYETEWIKASKFIHDYSSLFVQPEFDPSSFSKPLDLITHLSHLAANRFDDCANGYLVEQLRRMAPTTADTKT